MSRRTRYNSDDDGCSAFIGMCFGIVIAVAIVKRLFDLGKYLVGFPLISNQQTGGVVLLVLVLFIIAALGALIALIVRRKKLKDKVIESKLGETLSIVKVVKSKLGNKFSSEQEVNHYLDNDLPRLLQQIRANLQNKSVYDSLINELRENNNAVRNVLNRLEKNDYYTLKYEGILKQNDIWFDYQIEAKEKAERQKQSLNSLRDLETKRKSSAPSSYNPLGLSNTSNIQNKPIEKRQEKPVERSNQTERTTTPKENITENKPKPIIADTPKQQELEFEQETGNLIKTDTLPERRKRLTRPRVIKASPEFWKNLQNNRMETGKRGELLVMEYERKRIIKEEGKEFLYHLQHSSVTEGDGLGFDISSFYERRNVGIEVKTTTGNFDSNLIFTQNEINSMKILGENYFLYRVYDFDKKTNEGKLQIFKGREEIEAFFDFTTQTFTLKRKN
jgi:Domain of unknown function (DUF3883)